MKDFTKRYLDILNGELKGINLTRIQSFDEFYDKQILDSIIPIEKSPRFIKLASKDIPIIDIGFGGGFPLLPLAFKYPQFSFVGFEARAKKVEAVKILLQKLNISNVSVFHQRFEDILFDKESIITFKAVGSIPLLLENFHYSSPLHVYFYKGPNLSEQEELEKVSNRWKCIENFEVEIPNTQGRKFLGFDSQNVPRGTFQKRNKNLVKLSDFL